MIRKMRIILLGVTPIKYPDLPLAFVRSGYIYPPDSVVNNVGISGGWWARTVYSSIDAYYLYLYSTSVNPSSNYRRIHGFPLRCLYPGSA